MASGLSLGVLKGILVRALMEDASLAALIEGRVSGAFPEDVDQQDQPYPLVVVTFRAGLGNYNPVIQSTVFEVWAYSRVGQGEATAIYDLCFNALQAEHFVQYDPVGAPVMRLVAQETQRVTEGFNQRTRAWFARAGWLARAIG